MIKLHTQNFLPYFYMLPALLIEMITMISHGVGFHIWIQNLFIWVVGLSFCYVMSTKTTLKFLDISPLSITTVLIVLLIMPFWFNGIEGVHRWITFGPFNFYLASISLPILIVYLWKLSINKHLSLMIGFIFLIEGILLMQPDAGQITAFASASTIILWRTIENSIWKYISLLLLALFVIASWNFLDHLAPVPYVEQIIFLVTDMGSILLFLGVLAPLLLIYPFFIPWKKDTLSLALGLYFLMTILVTFVGHFPMPIMGYGISPIIGYLIAITAIQKIKIEQTEKERIYKR